MTDSHQLDIPKYLMVFSLARAMTSVYILSHLFDIWHLNATYVRILTFAGLIRFPHYKPVWTRSKILNTKICSFNLLFTEICFLDPFQQRWQWWSFRDIYLSDPVPTSVSSSTVILLFACVYLMGLYSDHNSQRKNSLSLLP